MVGRHLPSERESEPTIYRMKLWATDAVRAKSKFWCATRLPDAEVYPVRIEIVEAGV